MQKFSEYHFNAFVKLFHAFPSYGNNITQPKVMYQDYIYDGLIFLDKSGNIMEKVEEQYYRIARLVFSLREGQSFYRSWKNLYCNSDYQLCCDQIRHYFSTYGREMLGLKAEPFIPKEKILPESKMLPDIKTFVVIKFVSEEEAIKMIDGYLGATLAPKNTIINEIRELMKLSRISPNLIASFELRCIRYTQLGTAPRDPEEFLRYLIYKSTNKTLLIKNNSTINNIALAVSHDNTFASLFENADLSRLSEIFYRFKPLWLAFKKAPGCAPYINKMRRLATRYHKPMSDVTVQNASVLEKEWRLSDLNQVLNKSTIRQLVKLYNFGLNQTQAAHKEVSIFNIRNGKVWVKDNAVK